MDFAAYLGAGISGAVYGVVIKHFGYAPMFASWVVVSVISLRFFEKEENAIIVNRFKKFIRVSLQNHSINLHKKHSKLRETEIELEDAMLYDQAIEDDYLFLENFVRVTGFNMMIKNDLLYEALNSMEQKHRDIAFLSF